MRIGIVELCRPRNGVLAEGGMPTSQPIPPYTEQETSLEAPYRYTASQHTEAEHVEANTMHTTLPQLFQYIYSHN